MLFSPAFGHGALAFGLRFNVLAQLVARSRRACVSPLLRRGTAMRLFDALQKILILFLNAIALFEANPNPTKVLNDLSKQFNHVGFVL
jgi:hypothetical protein